MLSGRKGVKNDAFSSAWHEYSVQSDAYWQLPATRRAGGWPARGRLAGAGGLAELVGAVGRLGVG
jgi:hypothetical protein